ncbi:MAG: hypothetical protein ACO25B_03305 [Chitinophagaceae bacterium]
MDNPIIAPVIDHVLKAQIRSVTLLGMENTHSSSWMAMINEFSQ